MGPPVIGLFTLHSPRVQDGQFEMVIRQTLSMSSFLALDTACVE